MATATAGCAEAAAVAARAREGDSHAAPVNAGAVLFCGPATANHRQATASAPSLWQSQGEGWGGVQLPGFGFGFGSGSGFAFGSGSGSALPGSLPQRRSWQIRPRMGRRTGMCVVFRRDRDVSSKNPASGVDPRCAAAWARRQGVLSLGHVSLHKQRKVCSPPFRGRKLLFSHLTLETTSKSKAFTPRRGASYFSLLVQRKANQKKAHPASAPSALRATGSLRRQDFSTRHPCLVEERRTSLCVAPFGVLSASSVATEGDPASQRHKQQHKQLQQQRQQQPKPKPKPKQHLPSPD
jgi:hypothetical protein